MVKAISIHERRPQQVTTNVCQWIGAIDADDRDSRFLTANRTRSFAPALWPQCRTRVQVGRE
jgi:hypothetical protein